MSKPEILQEEVYSTDLFEFGKNSLVCSICNGILIEPQQCTTCFSFFCLKCIKISRIKTDKCPVKNCNNFNYQKSESSESMVKKLKFKCKNGCDKIIDYDNLRIHYDKECSKMDYGEKYMEQLAKYNFIKFQMMANSKKFDKLNENISHIKDARYFVQKMQNHPGINRYDWDYFQNRLERCLTNFKSVAESAESGGEREREGEGANRVFPNQDEIGNFRFVRRNIDEEDSENSEI